MKNCLQILFKAIIALIFTSLSFHGYGQAGAGYFTYTLPSSCNTSVGVYNSSGVLIRQIWSNKPETPGIKTAWWDGLDQFGNNASTPDSIKVEYFNITPNWKGVIANTGVQTGTNSLSGMFSNGVNGFDAVQVGSIIYYAGGYGEGHQSEFKTSNTNINSRINTVGPVMDCVLEFIASDGTNVYIAGYDAFATNRNTFVYAHTVSGETLVTFSSGTNYQPVNGTTTMSMIAYNSTGPLTTYEITGLAVQQTHNFLFVCRKGDNQVLVLNKTTGAVAQTITTITSPANCAVDASDNVWIADATNIKQYTVNSSTGALTATGVVVALTNVGGLRVSPNGSTITACDMTNRVVHAYRTSDGGSIWTLGTGDYRTDATVANNKFYWVDSTQTYYTFITYLSDSSFLIGDRQNGRVQHFANDHSTFLESQAYISSTYNISVDPKNKSAVYNGYRQYTVDYTQPIGSAGSLAKNWGASLNSTFTNSQFGLGTPVTLSNGRTYCFLRNSDYQVAELISGGVLRPTTVHESVGGGQYYTIDSLGNLVELAPGSGNVGSTATYTIYPLTGFDGSNNPIWSGTPSSTTTLPAVTNQGTKRGTINSNINTTTAGHIIVYDPGHATGPTGTGIGYHLAAIPIGGTAYTYQNFPSTTDSFYVGPFPGQGQSYTNGGYFDNFNNVGNAGGVLAINGNWVITGYHGEFWKNAQTNYYDLFDDRSGLFLLNFGASWFYYPNTPSGPQYGVPQTAGNALSGALVQGTDGNLYLVHGDESQHDGIHIWSFAGLNTATIITASYTPGGSAPVVVGTDILAGLTRGVTNVPNNTGGWVRSPTTDYNNGTGKTVSSVGSKSYDIFKSPDLYVNNNIIGGGQSNYFSYRLIPNGQRSNSWQQTFDVIWDISDNLVQSPPYNNGNFIEMVDSTGKIICEFHYAGTGSNTEYVVMNGVQVASDSLGASLYRLARNEKTITWTYTYGNLTMTLAGFNGNTYTYTTSTPFQSGAIMSQPYNLRLHYFVINDLGGASNFGYGIGIQNAFFNPNYKSFVICNGFGPCSLTSMAGHAAGDTAYIATQTGTYTSLTLQNLNGIIVRPQSGRPIFTTGSTMCNLKNMDVGFLSFQAATGTVGIDMSCGTVDSSSFHNLYFQDWASDCFNVNGGGSALTYIYGVDSTYKQLRNTYDSITEFHCNRLMDGSAGYSGVPKKDVCREITFSRIVDNNTSSTSFQGVGVTGIFFHCTATNIKITDLSGRGASGDVGWISGTGWWHVTDMYKYGGPGYDVRIFPLCEYRDTGSNWLTTSAKFSGTEYGFVNYQFASVDSAAGQYKGTSAYCFNNTMGNQYNDTLGYWSTMFNLGQVAPNCHYYVSNNLGFAIGNNNNNNSKPPLIVNLGGWNTIAGDTSNNQYGYSSTALHLDSTTVLFTNSSGSFPAFYLTNLTPGGALHGGITNPLVSVDYIGNPMRTPPDLGYIQFTGTIQQCLCIPNLHKGFRKLLITR